MIYPSIYLFSTKKNALLCLHQRFRGAFTNQPKRGPGGVFRQPTGGPPEIKVDGAQGLGNAWERDVFQTVLFGCKVT